MLDNLVIKNYWNKLEKKKPAPKFASGPSKKKYDGMRAVDRVRDDIIKQYGKGALINKKK